MMDDLQAEARGLGEYKLLASKLNTRSPLCTPWQEEHLLSIIRSVPGSHPSWVSVRGRRLQCFGGESPA
jgi:hypothetical protein